MGAKLSEVREREIFRELIGHQDQGPGRETIQAKVAERHGLSMEAIKAIERKGMAQDWPPLD